MEPCGLRSSSAFASWAPTSQSAGSASAHIGVTPGLLVVGDTQTLILTVHNDLDRPMTGLSVSAPDGVRIGLGDMGNEWEAIIEDGTATWTGGPLASQYRHHIRGRARGRRRDAGRARPAPGGAAVSGRRQPPLADLGDRHSGSTTSPRSDSPGRSSGALALSWRQPASRCLRCVAAAAHFKSNSGDRWYGRIAVIFTQFVDDALGCASYLVADESTGQAVVVDPAFAIEQYLEEAERRDVRTRPRSGDAHARRPSLRPRTACARARAPGQHSSGGRGRVSARRSRATAARSPSARSCSGASTRPGTGPSTAASP